MGIGNLFRDFRRQADVRLITPHGDWERFAIGYQLLNRSAHYPSWGFGTVLSAVIRTYTYFSLPLMGIGNSDPLNDEEPIWCLSLPLMAIRN